jgi:hypothetical protein
MYGTKWMFAIAMGLLVLGAVNGGIYALRGRDLLARGAVARILFGLIAVAALYVMFCKDTYFPFLGTTVLPSAVLTEKTPDGADTAVQVIVEPKAKVVFWAAEPGTDVLHNWQDAYGQFVNAGVTTADMNGVAMLRVRRPQPYTVPLKGTLAPHIHYRVSRDGALMDPVQTTYIRAEGFANVGHPKKKPADYNPDVLDDGSNGNYGASGDSWSGAGVEDFNQHGVGGTNSMSGASLEDGPARNQDWSVGADDATDGYAAAATSHPILNDLLK